MKNEWTSGHIPNEHALQALFFFPCVNGGIVYTQGLLFICV